MVQSHTPDYLLLHMPGSCSRVALAAMEELGQPYREKGVGLMRGEQYEPAFLAINPKGKVPVLIVDGSPITELPAMMYYLASQHPGAGLLPIGEDGRPRLESLSDLIWLSGTLHPLANRIFRPTGISTVDPDGVKAGATALLAGYADKIAARLGAQEYWYGDRWSIVDMLAAWIFWLARGSGFALTDYPALVAHAGRVEARPGFARTLAREQQSVTRDDLPLPPGFVL